MTEKKTKKKIIKTKKEMLKKEEKIDILEDNNIVVVSNKIGDKSVQRFEDYKRTNKILVGTVEGIKEDKKIYFRVDFDGYDVLIPEANYFPEDYEFGKTYNRLSDAKKLEKRKIAARFRIGSKCEFVIDSVIKPDKEHKKPSLLGNRVKALSMIKDKYFNPSIVKINDIVKADVLSVFENMVVLECLGVETRLTSYNLTDEKHIINCHDYCSSGDELDVRIKKVYINSKEDVYLSVSGRLNNGSKHIKNININETYLGHVDNYSKEKRLYTIKLKHGVNASIHERAVVSRGGLNIGDRVAVVVKEKKDDYVIGTCTKV